MRKTVSLIIISLIALVSWWFQDIWKEAPIVQIQKDKHFPDYFMENFILTNMDEHGSPAYILKAQKLLHYADDDSSELTQPSIEFFNTKGNWIISAERAQLLSDKQLIHLHNKVRLQRASSSQQPALSIDTDYLLIHTDQELAETDQPTRILSQGLELTSLGMVFDNRQGILKLLSNVKGTYEPVR